MPSHAASATTSSGGREMNDPRNDGMAQNAQRRSQPEASLRFATGPSVSRVRARLGTQAWPGISTSPAAAGRSTGEIGSSVRRSTGTCGSRGVPADDVGQAFGEVGVGVEAEHGVGLGELVGQLLAVALGQAPDGDDLGPAVRVVGGGQQGVDGVLLGLLHEPAGVDDDHVGLLVGLHQLPARPGQPTGQLLRVDLVAGTAQGEQGSTTRSGGSGHGHQGIRPPVIYSPAVATVAVRRSRTADVTTIKQLVDNYAGRVLLAKEIVTLYESVPEFLVAEMDGPDGVEVVGCGALHVLWEDLGEIRTVAVHPRVLGRGVGHAIVDGPDRGGPRAGLQRLFVLTFEKQFFSRHGFAEIDGTPVEPDVFAAMLRSYDAGVAEFLDLAHVKPNTLGNVRMLLRLTPPERG